MSSYNSMRMIVMFDIPNNNPKENLFYNKFRKCLISGGFAMMQYSVYIKALHNKNKFDNELKKIKNKLPPNGNIRVFCITENQYNQMILLRGSINSNEKINTLDRYLYIGENDEFNKD